MRLSIPKTRNVRPHTPLQRSVAGAIAGLGREHASKGVAPRLLTREQAANYCGVSIPTFAAHCPIRPISLGPGKRLERYDLHSLDHWIDALSGTTASFGKNWLAALETGHDGDSGERG